MSRPVTRTVEVNLDVCSGALGLFGTFGNAHKKLGLTGIMSYPIFYRALAFKPVRPDEKQLVEDAWDRWKTVFLRPEIPAGNDLALNHENTDVDPAWMVQSEPETKVVPIRPNNTTRTVKPSKRKAGGR